MFKAEYSRKLTCHVLFILTHLLSVSFSFEVNFAIFTAILSEQERAILAFKKRV